MASPPAGDVEITPTELKFRFQIGKQLLATISINNKSDQRQAFKIKTTAPKKYVVRPSSGVVDPKASLSVQVIMQAQKEYLSDFSNCKDKFMVQTTALPGDEQLDKDTFNKDVRKDLRETRLRVLIEGPPAPPSPVPEANEHDSEAHAAGTAVTADGTRAVPVVPAANQKADSGSDISALKNQVYALSKERDELRKQLDYVQLQGPPKKNPVKPEDSVLQFRVTIIHIILVAIVAFLLGQYL